MLGNYFSGMRSRKYLWLELDKINYLSPRTTNWYFDVGQVDLSLSISFAPTAHAPWYLEAQFFNHKIGIKWINFNVVDIT